MGQSAEVERVAMSYDTVAARIVQLEGKGALRRVAPLPERHVLERPFVITPFGHQHLD